MTAVHDPCAFRVGDTWPIAGLLFYADGTPFNLGAGATVAWELKSCGRDEDSVVVLSFALGTGITVTNAAGQILITVTPLQSAAIPPGEYVDWLRAADPAGLVSTQWTGTIKVRPGF
jgi:hypothetical protein